MEHVHPRPAYVVRGATTVTDFALGFGAFFFFFFCCCFRRRACADALTGLAPPYHAACGAAPRARRAAAAFAGVHATRRA